jgi:F-type H+-transporting ATPase subunit b
VFRANAEIIGSAITKAAATKAEADRQLADAESRLARLDQEVIALRSAAAKEAAADAERIREMAKSDAEKVSLAANAEIEAAERAARVELKSLAAKLAVDGAESLLVKQLTAQAQESLVNGFVESLEGRPN